MGSIVISLNYVKDCMQGIFFQKKVSRKYRCGPMEGLAYLLYQIKPNFGPNVIELLV